VIRSHNFQTYVAVTATGCGYITPGHPGQTPGTLCGSCTDLRVYQQPWLNFPSITERPGDNRDWHKPSACNMRVIISRAAAGLAILDNPELRDISGLGALRQVTGKNNRQAQHPRQPRRARLCWA
jgi:hypothetical protein